MRSLLRIQLAIFLPAAILTTSMMLAGPRAADPREQVKQDPVQDWKTDPACRLVFFAVLQGLYEDGVSDEVVNSIIPPDKKGEDKIKHSFILGCPLCRPAYEAFCVYQARPRFGDGSSTSHFGKGLDDLSKQCLLSEDLDTRLEELRARIRDWMHRRFESMDLSAAEGRQWNKRFEERHDQGKKALADLIKTDPHYREKWPKVFVNCSPCPSTPCAVCMGAKIASRQLKRER